MLGSLSVLSMGRILGVIGLVEVGESQTVNGLLSRLTQGVRRICGCLERIESRVNRRWNGGLFWLLCLPVLAFTVWRPYGIANDDFAYWQMFGKLCPIAECRQWLQSERDFVWYTLVAGLKSYWPDTRLVLAVSAGCLLVKLGVIFKLCRQPLLGLLTYLALFYPIFDLTALRISMASALFILGFYLLVRCCVLAGLPYLLVNGLVHKQAFSAPALLVGAMLGWRWWLLPLVIGVALLLVTLGAYPLHAAGHGLDGHLAALGLGESGLIADLWKYLNQQQLGRYDNVRRVPWSLLPVLAAAVWLGRDLFADDRRLYAYVAGSVTVAMACLWGMAALPEVQMRFVHFFLVPVVFLFGNVRPDWRKVAPVLLVALVFIIRYGVLHPVFKTPCTLDWVKLDPVSKQRVCDVPVR